jgi:hypothetical protein
MAEEQLAEQQNRRRQLLDENGFADDVVSDVAQRTVLPTLINDQCVLHNAANVDLCSVCYLSAVLH